MEKYNGTDNIYVRLEQAFQKSAADISEPLAFLEKEFLTKYDIRFETRF